MAQAEELAPCVLLVQHSDRLAPGDAVKGAHLVEYALWAIKAGVTVKSIQDPRACETILDAALMGMRNNEDSERKSKATADGVRRAVERGQWCAGVVPEGYEVLRDVDDRGRVTRTVVGTRRTRRSSNCSGRWRWRGGRRWRYCGSSTGAATRRGRSAGTGGRRRSRCAASTSR